MNAPLTEILATSAVILFLYMNLWFIYSLLKKRNDIVDVAWGGGFLMLAWLTFAAGGGGMRALLVSLMVTLWAVRLSWHIFRRNRGKTEDFRYKKWREEWGKWVVLRSYFQVYMLQGFFLFVIALPVMLVNQTENSPLGLPDVAGLLVWMIGYYFQSIGDAQLAAFKADPANAGRIMRYGLWQYTRHPNYFGEVVMWWGIWLVSMGAPVAWWSVVSPLVITLLILYVSGIPMLEKKYEGNAEFEEYKQRTNAFWPGIPK